MSDYICVIHHSEACAECVKEMRFLESQLRAADELAKIILERGPNESSNLLRALAAYEKARKPPV